MDGGKRDIELFNFSFLDVLSCGLGAVLTLLLVAFLHRGNTQVAAAEAKEKEAEAAGSQEDLEKVLALYRRLTAEKVRLEEEEWTNRARIDAFASVLDSLKLFRFSGIDSRGRNLVFLFDLSGSMVSMRHPLRKWAAGLLARMNPSEFAGDAPFRFTAFGFGASGASILPLSAPADARLVRADETALATAAAEIGGWIDGRMGGETPTAEALRRAFAVDGVDTIILITDGSPTDANHAEILAEVKRLNTRSVEVNTVGLGAGIYGDPVFTEFLSRLAGENDGSFVAVPGSL